MDGPSTRQRCTTEGRQHALTCSHASQLRHPPTCKANMHCPIQNCPEQLTSSLRAPVRPPPNLPMRRPALSATGGGTAAPPSRAAASPPGGGQQGAEGSGTDLPQPMVMAISWISTPSSASIAFSASSRFCRWHQCPERGEDLNQTWRARSSRPAASAGKPAHVLLDSTAAWPTTCPLL